jgi:hypothetical protein
VSDHIKGRLMVMICDSALVKAVRSGIDFLADSQLPTGAFRTYCSYSPSLAPGYVGRSPFVTTFVLHSIRAAQELATDNEMESRGIEYLLSEREPNRSWRVASFDAAGLGETGKIVSAYRGVSTET